MMKQIVRILLILCVFSTNLSSQTNWLHPSNQWDFHVYQGWSGEGLVHLTIGSDTAINNMTYSNVLVYNKFKTGAESSYNRQLRQDGRKLYALYNQGTTEFLMYDFDLAIGSEVNLPNYGILNTGFGYKIMDTSTLVINGAAHKAQTIQWIINSVLQTDRAAFVEGLGNVEGLYLIGAAWSLSRSYLFLDEPPALSFDGADRTFCSFMSSLGTYEALGNGLCKSVATHESVEELVRVYPNPSAGLLQIEASASNGAYSYRLLDVLGRSIAENQAIGSAAINTAYKGIAILEVQFGQESTRRMVVFE
jgi:hypothetical protein